MARQFKRHVEPTPEAPEQDNSSGVDSRQPYSVTVDDNQMEGSIQKAAAQIQEAMANIEVRLAHRLRLYAKEITEGQGMDLSDDPYIGEDPNYPDRW